MVDPDDLSPASARIANLTLAVGIGPLGDRIIVQLRRLLVAAEESHRRAIACWSGSEEESGLAAAAAQLLSNKNLDLLEQAGFQVPGRAVGQPPRLSQAFIVDLDDPQASRILDAARGHLASVSGATFVTIMAIGSAQVADMLAGDILSKHEWNRVLPVSKQDRVAGVRSDNDIVATVARMALLFSVADQSHFGSSVLGAAGAAGARTPVVRVGAAFLDCGREDLLNALSAPVAGRLLERQFTAPKGFQPPAAFDDQRRTKVLDLIRAEALAQRLLSNTPFTLSTDPGAPWQISLPLGVVTSELEGVPRRRWIAVLLKLRDLFDFAKARRWGEAIEDAESALLASLHTAIEDDVRQLHHYERGPDRLLTWAALASDVLERQPEIAQPSNADFDAAIERLRKQIQKAPNAVAVWARVALLGWLGAEGIRQLLRLIMGNAAGWAGFGITLVIAAVLGFRLLERAHEGLYSALHTAQEALIRKYEAQTRDNLILVLNRVRSRLLGSLDAEVQRLQRQAQKASTIASSMVDQFGGEEAGDLVNVEWLVPVGLRARLLQTLDPPWATLQSQAATGGEFVPAPIDGADTMKQTAAGLVEFARKYFDSRLDDFSLLRLLEFRGQEDDGFVDRIVQDLDRRATALAGRAPLSSTWHGPADVLAQFHEALVALDSNAHEQHSASGMVACVKVGAGVNARQGDAG
jgi:hypothetical protein